MTDESTTVRSIFFDSPADAATALGAALRSGAAADEVRGRLGRMPGAAKDAVLGEAGKVAAGVLEMDVTDIFRSAWTKHAALCAAAEASLDDPAEQVVPLATHSVTFEQDPGVEIQVANLAVATVAVHVQLDIAVRGLLAVVEAGRLTRVRIGAADFSGALEVAGQPLLERQKSVELRHALRLGNGIRLAPRA
ncbi:hypothetical protein BJ973_004065 [Actinoplanes tereljensis]|uniref:Uncharacterized protein n=1 Tax=Paractinoplanes tereljensis TaxID=571912 RepID=A0A919NRN8_9ACTN|nr:hypothetical protein [Actinoplanes tereljensis]GIF23453.1 hypothetical protein Ate02nite_61830 [Actinoplanes tereljensis]